MAIGTLTIGSHVDVDFLYITSGARPSGSENLEYEPVWDDTGKFLAKFDDSLVTGNLDPKGEPPSEWDIYRQAVGTDALDYVMTMHGVSVTCYDYIPSNNTEYIYHSFPKTAGANSEDTKSAPIAPNWNGWILITLDETEETGRYIPHEIFLFQYNLELSDMTNNTMFNQLETFTRYPFIQRSSSNHMSGQLKGLIGTVDYVTGQYYDTVAQAKAIRELTTDTRRKILKDLKGNVMEIELSNSVTFSILPNIEIEPYAASIQWTEVGDAEDLRVVIGAKEYNEVASEPYREPINVNYESHNHKQSDIIGLTDRFAELEAKIEEYRYVLPTASDTVKGGVKLGDSMTIDDETSIMDVRRVGTSKIVQDADVIIDLGDSES